MIFKRILPLATVLAAALVGSACNDSTGFEAQLETRRDTFIVYAMSGSAPELPTAYSSVGRQVMRVDTLLFDVAFDLTADGQVALLPVSVVGQSPLGRRIGIRADTVAFESLQRAPVQGYTHDSVLVVPVGRTVVVEAPGNTCGLYALSQNLYTKFVIDSVNPVTRQIGFHAVHNPNCGFRSLRPGIPKD